MKTLISPPLGHRPCLPEGLRGSIPGLRLPLSTLQMRPRERTRMARGQYGSLAAHQYGSSIHDSLQVLWRRRKILDSTPTHPHCRAALHVVTIIRLRLSLSSP